MPALLASEIISLEKGVPKGAMVALLMNFERKKLMAWKGVAGRAALT
jgi:hypothetical protein